MKCLKNAVVLAAITLVLASCASTKNESQNNIDNDEVYEIAVSNDAYDDYGSSSEIKKAPIKKKSSGNFFKDLFSSKFIEMSDGSLFTTKAFGGLAQQSCVFVLYPKKDTAGFGSPYMAAYYYITFDDINRINYIGAMEKYFKDFENKKLSRNDKKSYKAYGTVNAFIRWGAIKANNPYYAEKVSVILGYRFVGNSPYFTITIEPVIDESTDASKDSAMSVRLNYYFTKAQCRMSMDALSNEKINEFYNQYQNEMMGIPQEEDFYTDSSDELEEEIEDISEEQ